MFWNILVPIVEMIEKRSVKPLVNVVIPHGIIGKVVDDNVESTSYDEYEEEPYIADEEQEKEVACLFAKALKNTDWVPEKTKEELLKLLKNKEQTWECPLDLAQKIKEEMEKDGCKLVVDEKWFPILTENGKFKQVCPTKPECNLERWEDGKAKQTCPIEK